MDPEEMILPAGRFKARCLQLMDQVNERGVEIITKHGRPVARLVPDLFRNSAKRAARRSDQPGIMKEVYRLLPGR